jgi:protein ImuB
MEWWHSQEAKPTRDYFRVEDEAGQRFWLFRDGLYGEIRDADDQAVSPQWFVHGLFA